MKRYITVIFILLLPFAVAACGNDLKDEDNSSIVENEETLYEDSSREDESIMETADDEEMEDDVMGAEKIQIRIGDSTLTAVLEDNESAEALKRLMADGPLTIPASNYGGFEKVCSLGTVLPSNDSQTTTRAGDICLYNSNQIVIFYGSNSWAYTRIGKISDADEAELEKILSGKETEITLSFE